MSKKTILGLLTGAAIVAATTGSYAAWDKLKTDGIATVTLGNPITVSAGNVQITNTDASRTLNTAPTYTASVPITTSLNSRNNLQMSLTAVVKDGNSEVSPDAYTATIKKSGTEVSQPIVLTSTDETEITYTVEVTPNDNDAGEALAGKELSIGLHAEISAKQN